MKKAPVFSICILIGFILTVNVFCYDISPVVGSRYQKIYHKPSCDSVCSIKAKNLEVFESITEAQKLGYRACRRCFLRKD
jgi:methylphosphotriester-DNA--protein-cysteine methyltransferase